MGTGIASLVITACAVAFMTLRYWDTKGAVRIDE